MCVFSVLGRLAWAAQSPTARVAEECLGVDTPVPELSALPQEPEEMRMSAQPTTAESESRVQRDPCRLRATWDGALGK